MEWELKRAKPTEIELVPDAWAKFEKFVKGIVKAGPQHRPAKSGPARPAKKSGKKGVAK